VSWDHAQASGQIVVSKDSDFHQRSFLHGPPPKVIWVRLGNCSTAQIAALLRARLADVKAFADSEAEAFLVLG